LENFGGFFEKKNSILKLTKFPNFFGEKSCQIFDISELGLKIFYQLALHGNLEEE
jgi:hypothetical protein